MSKITAKQIRDIEPNEVDRIIGRLIEARSFEGRYYVWYEVTHLDREEIIKIKGELNARGFTVGEEAYTCPRQVVLLVSI